MKRNLLRKTMTLLLAGSLVLSSGMTTVSAEDVSSAEADSGAESAVTEEMSEEADTEFDMESDAASTMQEANEQSIEAVEEPEAVSDEAAEETLDVCPDSETEDVDEADAEEEEETSDSEESETEDAEPTKTVYTYEDQAVTVTVTLSDASAIPDEAELLVTEITPNTDGYNYETYMAALGDAIAQEEDTDAAENAAADGMVTLRQGDPETEDKSIEDSTLLYDIAFMGDRLDDEGNAIEGDRIEYQLESGKAEVSIQFKNQQLGNGLEAESANEIIVTHLPLTDEVRDTVDATKEATNFSKDDVVIDEVNADVSVQQESVSFELTGFSTVAIARNDYNNENIVESRTYEQMTDYSLSNLLSNYNLVLFDDLYKVTHINGAILVGGSVDFGNGEGFSIAPERPHTANSYIGGTSAISLQGYGTQGSDNVLILTKSGYDSLPYGIYSYNQKAYYITNDTVYVDMDVLRSSVEAQIKSYHASDSYVNAKINADLTSDKRTAYNVVLGSSTYISGAGTDANSSTNIYINYSGTEGDTVIYNDAYGEVNVYADFTKDTTYASGSQYSDAGNTVYMFPNATKVNIISTNGSINGHIVAPNADVTIAGGAINGTVIAKTLYMNNEMRLHTYSASKLNPTGLKLGGTKTVKGIDRSNEIFTFTLEELIDGTYTLIDSQSTTGAGTYTFKALSYTDTTSVGIHTYRVRETKGNAEGYTYDETVYTITVEVKVEQDTTDSDTKNVIATVTSIKSVKDGTETQLTASDTDQLNFENVYESEPETISLTVTKAWNGVTADDQSSVTMELYRKISGQNDGTKVDGKEVTLSKDKNWTATVEGLDKTDNNGNTYIYYFKESGESDGYVTIDGKTFAVTYSTQSMTTDKEICTVTNTLQKELQVEKKWEGVSDASSQSAITVRLYNSSNAKVGDDIVLSNSNSWKQSVTVPACDEKGNELTYYFREINDGTAVGDSGSEIIQIGGNSYQVSYAVAGDKTTITNKLIKSIDMPETGSNTRRNILQFGFTLLAFGLLLVMIRRKNAATF